MSLTATVGGIDFEFKDDDTTQQQIDDTTSEFFAKNPEFLPTQQPALQTQQQQAPIAQQVAAAPPPPNPLQQALGGALDPLLTIGTSVVAEPIAGLVGLATLPFAGTDKAVENIRRVQEALTFKPRTEAGKESLQAIGEFIAPVVEPFQRGAEALGEFGFEKGGPGLGTALQVAPLAALELVGLGGLRKLRGAKKVSGISDDVAANLEAQNFSLDDLDQTQLREIQQLDATRAEEASKLLTPEADLPTEQAIQASKPTTPEGKQIGKIKAGQTPEAREFSNILDDLKEKRTKKLARQVLPDVQIQRAAEDLGIDLNPDSYSTNTAFQEVTQALKASAPGSELTVIETAAIAKLGQKADGLIEEAGGFIDKSEFDSKLKSEFGETIKKLEVKADNAYQIVNKAIPAPTLVEATASKAFIKNRINELGGDKSLLESSEKALLSVNFEKADPLAALVGPTGPVKSPTYNALDTIRKRVGEAFNKSTGPYRNDSKGTLDQVYAVLINDQQGVADAFNVGEDFALGRKLVSERKDMEKASVEVFGRDVKSSILPKLRLAATALTKGDVSKFNNLINAIPKVRRPEAVATMLDDLFSLGARTQTGFGQGFVNAFKGLNKNKLAKNVLFSHLSPPVRKTFNDIGLVTTGLFRSKAFENASRSGIAINLVKGIDDGSLIGKIFSRAATGLGSVPFLSRISGARFTAIGLVEIMKKFPKPSALAAEFIASKKFREAIEESLKGNDIVADQIIKSSPKFKEWSKLLSPRDLEEIALVGFIPWITKPQEDL